MLQYNNLELIRVKNHSLIIIHLVLHDVLLKSFGVTLLVFNFYRYAGGIVRLGDSYILPGKTKAPQQTIQKKFRANYDRRRLELCSIFSFLMCNGMAAGKIPFGLYAKQVS